MRHLAVQCLVVTGCIAFAEPARAEDNQGETPPPAVQRTPTFIDVAFDIGGASSSNSTYEGGPEMGVTLLLRRWMLEVGPAVSGAAQVLSPASRADYGLLLGVGSEEWSFVGGDLLLEGGLRHYSQVGGCAPLLGPCQPGGVSGDEPYLGLRAGATLHPVHAPGTVFVGGLWFFVSHDLGSRDVTLNYPGLTSGPMSVPETVIIGGATEVGLSIRLGWDTRL